MAKKLVWPEWSEWFEILTSLTETGRKNQCLLYNCCGEGWSSILHEAIIFLILFVSAFVSSTTPISADIEMPA